MIPNGLPLRGSRRGRHPDLLGSEAIVFDNVAPRPRARHGNGRRLIAKRSVQTLANGSLPRAEVLRQMDMLEVVRVVDAGHRRQEGALTGEVHHLSARLLDSAIGRRQGGQTHPAEKWRRLERAVDTRQCAPDERTGPRSRSRRRRSLASGDDRTRATDGGLQPLA